MKRTLACLAGLLLGNLIVVPCISEPAGQGIQPSTVGRVDTPQEPVSELARHEWALGCAAVLTERNHDSHTLLGGRQPSEDSRVAKKRLLSEWWGIDNREDFFETLRWMDEGGHRAIFEKVGALVTLMTERQYRALLTDESNPEALNKLRVARRYYKELGPKSLYGWDYSRAICLCRWAYFVGYINEKEAWERIMPMATLLQEKFDSWEDLGRNYLIGRQFWSPEQMEKDGWCYEDAVQRLLDMKSSPWNRYLWELKLKNGEDKGPRRQPQHKEEPKNRKEKSDQIAALDRSPAGAYGL